MTRILCVEDNEDNFYLVKMRFEIIEGFDIAVAKDGAEDGATRAQGGSNGLADAPEEGRRPL